MAAAQQQAPTTDLPPHSAPGGHAASGAITDTADLRGHTILLATDGSPESDAAARVTAALASARGAHPVAARAFNPAPLVLPMAIPSVAASADLLLGYGAVEVAKREVQADLLRALQEPADWPVRVAAGMQGAVIIDIARETGAALVVMGLRPRSVLRRAAREQTVLRVLRDAEVPVLATTVDLVEQPQRIVVGVDFGRAGLCAARAALAVLADGGMILLTYVQPRQYPRSEDNEGIGVIHAQGVAGAFARLREELAAPASVRVETAVLEGDPSAELAALADRAMAHAIAVGSRRHALVDRLVLGSVTADLAHRADRSLLVVPPRAKR